MTDIIALDVSMGRSNVAWYRQTTRLDEFMFRHTRSGFKKLLSTIQSADHPVIYFEATGVYSRPVERFCVDHHLKYCLLNPLRLHLNSEDLRRVKTDRQDARNIALTAQRKSFRLTVPRSPRFARLHELSRFYNQLSHDWNHRLVQLHVALEQTFPEVKQLFKNSASKLALNVVELFPHPDLVKSLSRTKLKNQLIKLTDKNLSKMKGLKYAEQLLKLAQDSYPAVDSDSIQVEEVRHYCRLLIELTKQKEKVVKQMIATAQEEETFQYYISFPGIGAQTAAQLMGELGDITRFDSANQLNAYVGLDLNRYKSGNGGRQDHINKRGNPIARKLLYFAVGNMIRQQHVAPNHIVDYYYRLRQKRPYPKLNKVAMVACMNKTLKCLLSMIKHHTKYRYRYTDSKSTVKI